MGPRALTASSGLAPWSMAVDRYSAWEREKMRLLNRGQGGLPLMLPPPLRESGGHPRNFHDSSKKLRRDFSRAKNSFFLGSQVNLNCDYQGGLPHSPKRGEPSHGRHPLTRLSRYLINVLRELSHFGGCPGGGGGGHDMLEPPRAIIEENVLYPS